MNDTVEHISNIVERMNGEFELLNKQKRAIEKQLQTTRNDLFIAQKAANTANAAAEITQNQIKRTIEKSVNKAMSIVFEENAYSFEVEPSTNNKGNISYNFWFERDGLFINPKSTSGGAGQLAELALRFVRWALARKRVNDVIILDEPLKDLKGEDYPEKGAYVIRELSHQLDLQIIMVSHDPTLIEHADNIINLEEI